MSFTRICMYMIHTNSAYDIPITICAPLQRAALESFSEISVLEISQSEFIGHKITSFLTYSPVLYSMLLAVYADSQVLEATGNSLPIWANVSCLFLLTISGKYRSRDCCKFSTLAWLSVYISSTFKQFPDF